VLTISIKLAGKRYLEIYYTPTSSLLGASSSHWGTNAAEKEGKGAQLLQLVRISTSILQNVFYRTSMSFGALLGEPPNHQDRIIVTYVTSCPHEILRRACHHSLWCGTWYLQIYYSSTSNSDQTTRVGAPNIQNVRSRKSRILHGSRASSKKSE
jgi:hypothetical protein